MSSFLSVATAVQSEKYDSLYELTMSGGPIMIPIGLCSIVALAYATERWLRLRPTYLGTAKHARHIVEACEKEGVDGALAVCKKSSTSLARVLSVGLARASSPFQEREKAVEDAAASEMDRLSVNLRPILLVYLVAPLLGLLGTVWGLILAFTEIALAEGLGKPELLAKGVYQALVTTAAGLVVAIPAIVAHQYLKARIDAFVRRLEGVWSEVETRLTTARGS